MGRLLERKHEHAQAGTNKVGAGNVPATENMSRRRTGEQEKEPAIARAWADFDTLLAVRHGDQSAFAYWTDQLYAPLYQHAQWRDPGDDA